MAKRKASAAVEGGQQQAAKQQRKQRKQQVDAVEGDGPSSSGAVVIAGTAGGWKNKEKVLLLSSRGITYRFRHLMLDLGQLLPHGKRDAKLDTKSERGVINEVADMKGCTSVLYFEARKHKDLYLWLAKAPGGPSAKFHVTNVHTLEELKLSGNHLQGSRPVLSFDKNFDEQPHLQVLKEMLTQVGPRACLNPIKMFAGSFGGPVIYENPGYVSPNTIRAMLKRQQQGKYVSKVQSREGRKAHVAAHPLPRDELGDVFK
ncbi:hypothetical protein CHLNCDRAFT_141045 [Chlorella variabilis]|uniref:Brix domain-containing protein n=1 Tax=Chlorella variabilis TaxID=554065 RepID=E1ZS14_CHLVA|nr:hypothetical protein CHLNCDRAFT_141045 [Chlorella variabilis]EFN51407.1 hypothetical protein CHLNCDRAFT_141045 [Chlorella variabilis]|eukprot:XP_005843509.1 hypothetical protein CHLNCDRAFT_141045 [Chlorella variabilis]